MALTFHQQPASVSQSEQVRCSACKVEVSPQDKLSHYRSDWHRYNVKRKCVGMPPLSQQLFESKLSSIIATGKQVGGSSRKNKKTANSQHGAANYDVLKRSDQWQRDAASLRNLMDTTASLLVYKCTLCHKSFKSHQTCSSHLATKKHRSEFIKYHKALRSQQQDEIDVFRATNGTDPESEAASVPTQHALDQLVPVHKLKVDVSIKGNPFVEIKPFQPRPPKDHRWAPIEDPPNDEGSNSDGDGGHDANAQVDGDHAPPVIPDPVDTTKHCLFCGNLDAHSVEEVMSHMELEHGFFIPRPERLMALEPLLEVAGKVVGRYHQCCWCWSRFVSLEAVQNHMRDRQHCKLMIDDDTNPFQDHFDWNKVIPIDLDASDDDAEMKEDGRQLMVSGKRPHIQDMNADRELVRSDGTRIGHRAYAVAYKQRTDRLLSHRETQSEEQIIAQINNPERKLKMEMMLKKKAQEAFEASGAVEQGKGNAKEQEKLMNYQQRAHVVSKENWIALQKSRCLF